MSLNTRSLQASLITHAKSRGFFSDVAAHPPMSPPTKAVSLYLWLASVAPIPGRSGLASTSVLVTFTGQILTNVRQQPYDGIDEKILNALDSYCAALSADFELGGLVEQVDLLGAYGPGLTATAGWVTIDNAQFRSMNVSIPLVVDDLWVQAA